MFDYAKIADPTFFCQNRRPAHSSHRWYASPAEAESGHSSFEQNLNGVWKFHYAKNLDMMVAGFESPSYDCDSWDDIRVPAHIQLQGYDRPQYCNVQYPWDGYEQIEPGQLPQRYNPVGSYVKMFSLERPLAAGERLSVVFHGAESAIAVWLNGVYIGYSCDSFTPSEFDLTKALVEGENKLAVQVFRFSGASWIEDQDFYRFSGIFRDVILYRRPATHAEDISIASTLSDDFTQASVRVHVKLDGPGTATVSLGDTKIALDGDGDAQLPIAGPRLWSAEDPYLYRLVVDVCNSDGTPAELVPLEVGVRRFGIEDGLLKINGRRVVLKGVNRHEFGLAGRVMSPQQTEADIRLMKANGINAVRTSHYPNNTFFYDLADRYGLYVVDEMNLESHGLWDAVVRGRRPASQAVPGDLPEWLPVVLDRAQSMFERDKNHPSVVMWSLGNESFGGKNLAAVADWFRQADPSRPVHYEGIHWDRRYPQTSDVESQMYTPAAQVEEFLKTHRDKPFIMCEYAHAMGNSFGAVDKYTELAYREPLFQGGFIWDFADQAILRKDRYGQPFFAYGGDCGDAPSDYEFCGDGILFADHTPSPKMQEVKYLYQDFRIRIDRDQVRVENRHLFTDSSVFDCVVSLAEQDVVLARQTVATAIAPGCAASFPLPLRLPETPGEYLVEVSFRLRTPTAWAGAGHEVAFEQAVFRVEAPAGAVSPTRTPRPPELVEGVHNVGVRGPHFTALFSRLYGGLVSYRYGQTPDGGRELLASIPKPNFWHAPTSNEKGWQMGARDGQWLLASLYAQAGPADPTVAEYDDRVGVTYHYALPTTPASGCDVTYLVDREGRVEVVMEVRPGDGLPDLPEFGLLLKTDADLHRLRWYGDGPDECYVDRRGGARLGVYEGEVARQLTPYLRPQEAGSHTRVRWASVTDDVGAGLLFTCADGMEFSALPHTPFEIENAAHHHELPPFHHTVLRPAQMRRGVGGDNTWGAKTHPEYCLPPTPPPFRFTFQGTL